MCKYKFRGSSLDNAQWVIGNLIHECTGEMFIVESFLHGEFGEKVARDWHMVDPSTVCQYSTVNLKDGTELYEGDIVQHTTAKWIGVIVFGDGAFKVKASHGTWVLDKLRAERLVKLGNRWDDEELLTKEKQHEKTKQ